ncbi:retropepsin-like aspartic protease [Paenibacillus chitinolyticus]|uniref:retropepsin-like aspartic protease n=1 Tax=Paenibacillus chitinolyticus TaxID=79263 RepID=UPI0035DD6B13
MQIDLIDGLLQTSITICYKGQSLIIDNLVIDTGAAHSLLSSDVVSEIGITFENGDKLLRSFGVGGDEYSFQKRVDQIQLGNIIIEDFPMDCGVFHEDINYINGIIGLDILKTGNMIIDLHQMQLYPATSK